MVNGSYTKKILKNFYNEMTIDTNGYPIYRRRDDERFVQKGDGSSQYQSIGKYLFKYINKGPDKATMLVQENVTRNEISRQKQIIDVDEIKSYLDCGYIFACEACWIIEAKIIIGSKIGTKVLIP